MWTAHIYDIFLGRLRYNCVPEKDLRPTHQQLPVYWTKNLLRTTNCKEYALSWLKIDACAH